MKRIQQHLRYDPGPTRLYLDELDEIVECLRSSTEGVEIRTAQFQLEGADTLAELKKDVIHELTIQSRSPSISLYLWPRGATLETFEDDPKTRGVFEAVKDILAANRASFSRWSNFPMLGGAVLGLRYNEIDGDRDWIVSS